MAFSQIPFNYSGVNASLVNALSAERFRTYDLMSGFNSDYAFRLYLYNARLAKAFLFPIHILEITLRNRMSSIFEKKYGLRWPYNPQFRDRLSVESLLALDKGIARSDNGSTGKVISELTFDFWSNLFRKEYYFPFWQENLSKVIPYSSLNLKDFRKVLITINQFRNRVAHHEPILKLDLSTLHSQIIETMGYICPDTKNWIKHHSTVYQIMRTKPALLSNHSISIKDRSDSNFIRVSCSEKLSVIYTQKIFDGFIVCQKDGLNIAVVTSNDVGRFLLHSVDNAGDLLLSLNEYTYQDVIESLILETNFCCVGGGENFEFISQFFKGARIKYLIVIDSNESIVGIIEKAHRRY